MFLGHDTLVQTYCTQCLLTVRERNQRGKVTVLHKHPEQGFFSLERNIDLGTQWIICSSDMTHC